MKMITNLFSTFDPASSIFSNSWIIIISALLLTTGRIWKNESTLIASFKKVVETFKKELRYNLQEREKGPKAIIMRIFILILPLNFLALYPQLFSITAHLSFTLPTSMILWITVTMYGWTKKTKHILSHLLPQGTPLALMNFIVLIELTRRIIRPITLCVRLTANIIAGHLLMSLLGNALLTIRRTVAIIIISVPIILTILESAVAGIQAYVFITLISLYTAELK
jgi:F-type H+-transporting ATPase subunit a